MHIHIGVLSAFLAFLAILPFGFFWRVIAAHNSDNALGKAMSFIY